MVLHRSVELAALTGQVESAQNHLSGKPTNQELVAGSQDGVISGKATKEVGNMRGYWVSLIATLATVTTVLIGPSPLVGQSAARVPAKSSFTGIWEGKMNDLPGIDLTIDEAGGKVSGAIVFYFQERSSSHVAGESPVPLLVPHVEGKTLTFEVQRHKCYGCAELGANVKFRMELTAQNEARLWNLENQDASKDLGPGLKLVRRPESASPQEPTKGN
jgi:hypothetical protein